MAPADHGTIVRLLGTLLIAATAAISEASTVTVRMVPHGASFDGVHVTARAASASDLSKTPAVIQQIDPATGSASLRLADGYWLLAADGPQVWSRSQYIAIAGDSEASLDLWPAGALIGALPDTMKAPPRELTARFDRGGEEPLQDDARCTLADRAFRCVLPAGRLDARIRAKGYVGRSYWDLTIEAGKTHDVGTLELRPGQSILGRVLLPRGDQSDIRNVVVTAFPSGMAALSDRLPPFRLLPLTVHAGKNGRYEIDGVAPGTYLVSAASGRNLYTDSYQVVVRPAADTELLDILRLEHPRHLAVSVVPATAAPDGRPWHVALERALDPSHHVIVTESNASRTGSWRSGPLKPALYTLSIGPRPGDVWYREEIPLTSRDVEIPVTLSARSVHGLVTLGSHGLASALTFSGDGQTVKATADDDGAFTTQLPNDGPWSVDVESAAPQVKRTVQKVRVTEEGSIAIRLPNSALDGDVVDEQGRPVEYALLTIARPDGREPLFQPSAGADGRFTVNGMSSGTYKVAASAPRGEGQSEPADVVFDEERLGEPLHLTIHPDKRVRGRVVFDTLPVPGATVMLFPTDVSGLMTVPAITDASGGFEIPIPNGAGEFNVVVAAPGFAYELDHVQYRPERLFVTLSQNGGTMQLRWPAGEPALLVKEGVAISPSTVLLTWPGTSEKSADAVRMMLPMMAPGPYALCSVAASEITAFQRNRGSGGGRCVSGFLGPAGTLALDATGNP